MSKYKVLTDGNGSKLIQVVGMGLYMPLDDHQAMVKECEYSSKLLAEAMTERDSALAQNAELVAMLAAVHQVRAEAVLVAANSCRFMADINTDDGVFKREICLLEDLEQYAELAKGGEV